MNPIKKKFETLTGNRSALQLIKIVSPSVSPNKKLSIYHIDN